MNQEPDWERIALEYRLGVFSTREIARRHQVPEATIRKRAASWRWEHDLLTLAQEVAQRVNRQEFGHGFGTRKILRNLFNIGFP